MTGSLPSYRTDQTGRDLPPADLRLSRDRYDAQADVQEEARASHDARWRLSQGWTQRGATAGGAAGAALIARR